MLALWGQDKHEQIKHIKTSVFFQIAEIYLFSQINEYRSK